jgi:hypothetical protein
MHTFTGYKEDCLIELSVEQEIFYRAGHEGPADFGNERIRLKVSGD